MRDKPTIDRYRVSRTERRARYVLRLARDITRLTNPGEELRRPVRNGDQIVLGVVRRGKDSPKIDSDVKGLLTAWFESGTL